MMTRMAWNMSRLPADQGKPLVYVDYLETAPWNWHLPHLGQEGEFTGLGGRLVHVAIHQSLAEGFHGRVGLHALPQAERFYERTCGMTRLGPDPDHQQLVYFEFSREQAAQFVASDS